MMRQCAVCDAPIDHLAGVCQKCGTEYLADGVRQCEVCGAAIDHLAGLCQKCGAEHLAEGAVETNILRPPRWGEISVSLSKLPADRRESAISAIEREWEYLQENTHRKLFSGQLNDEVLSSGDLKLYGPYSSFVFFEKALSDYGDDLVAYIDLPSGVIDRIKRPFVRRDDRFIKILAAIQGNQPRMNVTLKQFLTEGSFGSVKVGMSKAQILAVAGEPGEFARGTCLEDAEIWNNGRVTFWFEGDLDVLDRIGIYLANPFQIDFRKNENIQYDSFFPNFGARMSSMIDFLEREDIKFSTATTHRTEITTSGGVAILGTRSGEVASLICPPVLTGKAKKA